MKVFFSDSYCVAGYGFDTTRKPRWIAESLERDPIEGVQVVAPVPLRREEVLAVHSQPYVEAVRTGEPAELASSQGFNWDPDVWTMTLASNGGARDAAMRALKDGVAGSLSSGLHHARRESGSGFCTFNGLAIAALQAVHKGAKQVLILDLDAHHGGGTHDLIANHPAIRHIDIATSSFDAFSPAANESTHLVSSPGRYREALEAELGSVVGSVDLCLYNAGVDCEERCDVGGLKGIDADFIDEREVRVFSWCKERGIPVAFVLAGGYTGPALPLRELVDLHRLTIAAAAEVNSTKKSAAR